MQTIAITTTSITVVITHIVVDVSKLQTNKHLIINEGGSSSRVKPIDTLHKHKGKGIEPTDVEKKQIKELEAEKMRELNSLMRQRANDPPGSNKGDVNKM